MNIFYERLLTTFIILRSEFWTKHTLFDKAFVISLHLINEMVHYCSGTPIYPTFVIKEKKG